MKWFLWFYWGLYSAGASATQTDEQSMKDKLLSMLDPSSMMHN